MFVVPFGTPKGQRKTGSEPQTDDEAGLSGINDPPFFPSHAAGLQFGPATTEKFRPEKLALLCRILPFIARKT